MGYSPNIFLLMPKVIWDADALAYIAAAGITNTTEKLAANYLFTQLKVQGIYSKLLAFYPILGGTSVTQKYNGKNPLDTNGAFRLTYVGGVTHSSTGIIFNGSTGYARTYFTPSTNWSGNNDMSIGGNFNYVAAAGDFYFGSNTSASGYTLIQVAGGASLNIDTNCLSGNVDSLSVTSLSGLKVISRGNSTDILILNESAVTNPAQPSTSQSIREMYIGCRNNNGTAAGFLQGTCKSFYIGDYLDSTELAALDTIDTNFQTMVGR